MPVLKIAPFKIEEINQSNGYCIVRFINKYGPIYTGEKTLEDFLTTIEIPTGDINNDGTIVTTSTQVAITDNPNDDSINSVDIPIDVNGQYISSDALLEHIAKHYPHDYFEDMKNRKTALLNSDLNSLVNQHYEITIEYPDPITVTQNIIFTETPDGTLAMSPP